MFYQIIVIIAILCTTAIANNYDSCDPCDSTILSFIDSLVNNQTKKKKPNSTVKRKIIKKEIKNSEPIHIIQILQNCCPDNDIDSTNSVKILKKDNFKFKYQFILDFIIKISWQLLILFLFVRFRNQISDLILNLKKMKVGNFDFEFSQNIQNALIRAEEDIEQDVESEEEGSKIKSKSFSDEIKKTPFKSPFNHEHLFTIAINSPSSAIIRSWYLITEKIYEMADVLNIKEKNIDKLLDTIVSKGEIPLSLADSIKELFILKNYTAHLYNVDSQKARAYVAVTKIVVIKIDLLIHKIRINMMN